MNCSQIAMFQKIPALCPQGQRRGGGWCGDRGGQPNTDRPGQGEGGPKNSQICANILYR